jgi:ATP-dependent helicase/nuclease subunit B
MNTFLRSIAGICADHPVAEKRLVSPSRRVGHQWLYRVAREGRPCLNWRIETLRSIVVELAAPAMAARGVTVAPRRAALLIAERALAAQSKKLKYLNDAGGGTGLAAALLNSISALRLEGIDAGRLRRGLLEDDRKAADLKHLLGSYLDLLAKERLVDYGGVLQMALERLAADPDALGADTIVLLPADLERRGLERTLLDALPAERLRELAVDEEGLPPTLHFANAVGEANEVRSALRACLAGGVPLDEVELLHTDADTYVPLVLETFDAVERPGADPPVTFAEGIPCDRSRPGRALAAWLRWMREDCPQRLLTEMVREGLLETGEGEEGVGFGRLARLLRSMGIGFGRDRYLVRIDRRIESLTHLLAAAGTIDAGDEDGRAVHASRAARERDLAALHALRVMVERLLGISPPPDADGAVLASAARRFLAECARSVGRLDTFARERLDEELAGMAHWLERTGGANSDIRFWIEALPRETRVLGSGPRPEHLHVDHVTSGGHSGRRRLFVLGLDDSRFPGAGLQDPLLLDGERGRLSPGMPTAGRLLEERVAAFRRLLARQGGETTLSWSCRNVIADSELFPGPVVLDAFRAHTEKPSADQGDLIDSLPLPSSFAPVAAGEELDLTEWWLRRLTENEKVANAGELLARHAPHLTRGRVAAAARREPVFTAWDGRVPAAGADLDPSAKAGKVLSSNGLEAAGACPLRFFFRYGLEIGPPEEIVVDPSRWLDPLARGSLLHELFEEFLRGLIDGGRAPSFDKDREALRALLDRKIAAARDAFPPPSEAACRREIDGLELTAETFLKAEEHYQRETKNTPAYLEASIGIGPDGEGTDIDDPEPVAVDLPGGGGTIRIRGRIDRIDRIAGGGGWAIWDYKTGSSYGYDRADPFREGRKVQPWLYPRIVEARLRAALSPEEAVRFFGYFFPGLRAAGERIGWDAARLDKGGNVVARLCRLISAGAFAPTTDENDCKYCDYLPLCGDVKGLAEGSRGKVLSKDPLLKPLRKLREESLKKYTEEKEGKS